MGNIKNRPDAVVTQRSCDDGFTKADILRLLDHLDLTADEEVDPIYLEGDSAIAFGFIRMDVSEERLSFDTSANSDFGRELIAVVNDIELETEDGRYKFAGVDTLMYY